MFAEISSANVVGYMNKAGNANRLTLANKFFNVPFDVVGSEGAYITDIKVAGYQDVDSWQKNISAPAVELRELSNGNATIADYVWTDTYDKNSGTWAGGYWKHLETGKKLVKTVVDTETEEADVLLSPGKALWTKVPATKKTGCTIQLSYAGQVITGSPSFPMNSNRLTLKNQGIGNMLQRPVTLTELSVTGYHDVDSWQKNITAPAIEIKELSNGSATIADYVWTDTYDKNSGTWAGGYWKHLETGKAIVKEVTDPETQEADITIAPGSGYWVKCPATKKTGCTISLQFPEMVIE